MQLFSANIQDLKTLYISRLKTSLSMEQQIVKALPDMVEASTDTQLKQAFQKHLEQSKGHAAQVESLVQQHTGDNDTNTCKVTEALVGAAASTIKDVKNQEVRDVALIGAGQQVEHLEIAVYGTLKHWADILGFRQDASVLQAIESEEKQTDQALTQLSESLNSVAA